MAAVGFALPSADGRRTSFSAALGRRSSAPDPTLLEVGFCAAFMIMTSQALLGRLGDPAGSGDGALWLRLMWLPAYAVIIGLAASRRRNILVLGRSILPIILLVAWAALSTLWSVNSDVSLRRALSLACTTAFALYVAARFSWRGLLQLIGGVAALLALGSLLAAALSPSFAIQVNNGAWRGLWFEKNAMGGFMARGACACLCAFAFGGPRRQIWLVAAGLCAALTILSTSTTAILALGLGVGTLGLLVLLRKGPLVALAGSGAAVTAAAIALVLATLLPSLTFDLTGKDPTLTGRTQLWAAVLEQAAQQPLHGYGYAAFWSDQSAPSQEVRAQVQWEARNADNGWLDILVQLGGVGIGLLIWSFVILLKRGVPTLASTPEGLWFASSTVVLWVASLSESILVRSNDCSWIFFVATAAKLSVPKLSLAGRQRERRTARVTAGQARDPQPPITRLQLNDVLQLGRYAVTVGPRGLKIIEALPQPLRIYLALGALGPSIARAHPLVRAQTIADLIDGLANEIKAKPSGGHARARRAHRLLHALAVDEMADAAIAVGLGQGRQARLGRRVVLEEQLRRSYPQIWAMLKDRMRRNNVPSREAATNTWEAVREAVQPLSPSMVLRCIAQGQARPSLPVDARDGDGRS